MARLIDANAKELLERINRNFGSVTRYIIKSILKDTPTVDAVEVVRCKDCKHLGRPSCAMDTYCFDVTEEGFCSYGERREGE